MRQVQETLILHFNLQIQVHLAVPLYIQLLCELMSSLVNMSTSPTAVVISL